MIDTPRTTQHPTVRVHAAVFGGPADFRETREMHRVRIHTLGGGAHPFHLRARKQTRTHVTPVALGAGLAVDVGRRRGGTAGQDRLKKDNIQNEVRVQVRRIGKYSFEKAHELFLPNNI